MSSATDGKGAHRWTCPEWRSSVGPRGDVIGGLAERHRWTSDDAIVIGGAGSKSSVRPTLRFVIGEPRTLRFVIGEPRSGSSVDVQGESPGQNLVICRSQDTPIPKATEDKGREAWLAPKPAERGAAGLEASRLRETHCEAGRATQLNSEAALLELETLVKDSKAMLLETREKKAKQRVELGSLDAAWQQGQGLTNKSSAVGWPVGSGAENRTNGTCENHTPVVSSLGRINLKHGRAGTRPQNSVPRIPRRQVCLPGRDRSVCLQVVGCG